LFGSVAVSGIRVLSYLKWDRRNRFILGGALSFGLGELLFPNAFGHLFDSVKTDNKGLAGFLTSINIILTTPCEYFDWLTECHDFYPSKIEVLLAGIVAVTLNGILPSDAPDAEEKEITGVKTVESV